MIKLKSSFTFFLYFLLTQVSTAQKDSVTFTAHSNSIEIYQNQEFEVFFELKNAIGKDFIPPSFKGFEVISGPFSSSSMKIISGKSTRSHRYTFKLKNKKFGNFTINHASINVSSRRLKSNSLNIIVLKGSPKITDFSGDSIDLEKAIFLKLEVNKKEAYVGEQIRINYVLYSTFDLSRHEITDPEFVYFRAQDLEAYSRRHTEVILGGRKYKKIILKELALYPLKKDSLTISSASLEVEFLRRDTAFSGPQASGELRTNNVKATILSDPVQIYVKRLVPPDLGIPSNTKMQVRLKQEGEYHQNGKLIGERTFEYVIYGSRDLKLSPVVRFFDTKTQEVKTISLSTRNISVKHSSSPPYIKKGNKRKKDTNIQSDLVFVADISSSMLAQDIYPDRLEVMKRIIKTFVGHHPNKRVGLVLFAGKSKVLCPLTSELSVIETYIDSIQVGQLEDGSAIGMGVATALNLLKEAPSNDKSIVLFTDGDNNSGYLHPLLTAQMAGQLKIPIYSISLGKNGQTLAPVSRKSNGDYIFSSVEVKIKEDVMKQMAKYNGGQYFRMEKASQLEMILWTLLNINKSSKVEMEKSSLDLNQTNNILKGIINDKY